MSTDFFTTAVRIATKAHLGQVDKAGAPYITHPIRLMMRAETEDQKVVAVLHDVIEDSDFTQADLIAAGIPPRLAFCVQCLTHKKGEHYDAYIERVACDSLARPVKILDLEDNMDITRLPFITPKDVIRLKKYHGAWRRLCQ